MARLSDDTHDRALVLLALLGPLLMLILSKWQASLETWYAPLDTLAPAQSSPGFEAKASAWLAATDSTGQRLVLIASRTCPCTKATLSNLETAIRSSPARNTRLVVRYIEDDPGQADRAWRPLLSEIPATPTLLAVDNGKLLYAGPVNTGNFCSTAVGKVLGVSVLTSRPAAPLLNWLARGCYCPTPPSKPSQTRSNPSPAKRVSRAM